VDAIAIEGHGQAVRGEDVVQERGIAMEIFGGPEMQCDDFRGRVVDRPEERQHWPARLEPGKGAAVELEQLPGRGLAGASGASQGRAAAMDGGPAEGDAP